MIQSLVAFVLLTTAATAEPLALDDCIQLALKFNNQMRLARQSLLRSEADVKSARASRLPSVSATLINFSRSRTGPSVRIQENPTGEHDPVTGQRIFREETTQIPPIDRHSFSLSASVNQSIYDGGNRRHAHNSARSGLEGTQSFVHAQRLATIFAVKQHYFTLLKAQELVEVLKQSLRLSEKQFEEATARLEVGAGVKADVLRLRVSVGNAQINLINGEQGIALARANLNKIMGKKISASLQAIPVKNTASTLSKLSFEELLQRAEESNPELQRLRFVLHAAGHNLAAAKAAWHPRVNGRLSYSRNNEVFDRVYQDLDKNYRLNGSVTLTYNVFDGGLRSASIDRSRVGLENARLNLEEKKRELNLSVETAHLELVRVKKILEISAVTMEVAEEDLKLAEESYRIGQGTLLELLDAQISLTQARSDQVRGRRDLAVAQAEVERLVGGLSDGN